MDNAAEALASLERRGLFVESDRMGWPTLSEEAHRGECEVVKEETRLRFLNKPKTEPIGGWWLDMRALAFDGYPNAHDGTGSFEEIEASSVEPPLSARAKRLWVGGRSPGSRAYLPRLPDSALRISGREIA